MKKTLLVLFALTNLFAFAQEETFRVKPWKKYAGYYEQNKIVISEEGKMIEFPQFLYLDKVIEKNCKESKYFFDPKLIQFVDKHGESISLDQIQVNSFNDLKGRLQSIKNLNSDFSKEENSEELQKRKDELEALLKRNGLTISGYFLAIDEILIGNQPNADYATYFPDSLHTMFDSIGNCGKNFKQAFTIEIKAAHDEPSKKCTCKNETVTKCKVTKSSMSKVAVEACGHSGKFTFNVSMTNPFTELIMQALMINRDPKPFEEEFDEIQMIYENELLTDSCASEYINLVKRLDTLVLENKSKEDKWKLSWVWFAGKVADDPFMGDLPNSKYSKIDLNKTAAEIEAYKLMLNSAGSSNNPELEKWSDKFARLMLKKDSISKMLSDKGKYEANYREQLKKYFSKSDTWYEGIFYLSQKSDKHLMRNHDGSNDFKQFVDQREDYYSFESIHYLSHNHVDNKKVKLTTSGEIISSHQPSWVADVNQVFSGLSSSFDLKTDNSIHLLNSFITKNPNKYNSSEEGSDCQKAKKEEIEELGRVIKDMDNGFTLAKWIDQSVKQKPVDVKRGKTIEITPESKGYKLSSDVSYTFSTFKDDGTVDKAYPFVKAFRHYKKSFVQLYGGLNVSLTNVDRVVIPDEDAEQVDPKIESDPFQFVAGIKVYPWGGVLEDNRFMAFNKHRLHVNLGFSIPKPLANIYTGIGYDIIPGWNINFNAHFYQDKEYIIVDGEVEHSRSIYRPGFAIGTGMDVSVFVNAVKFFFK